MPQNNPSILTAAQAVALLTQIQQQTSNGNTQNLQDISTQLASAITGFEQGTTKPVFQFRKIELGEPPLSDVINKNWNAIATDIGLLNVQADILKSAAIILYNNTITELNQINNMNGEIANQLATISLFNNTVDSKTFIFSDQFGSGGNIDTTFPLGDNVAQLNNGYLTLAAVGQNTDLTQNATIQILPKSNGFPGDNQEIEDPSNATTNTLTTSPQYTFVGASNNPSIPKVVLDNQSSNTFFEYEVYSVNAADKATANNYNFTYNVTGSNIAQYPNAVNGQIDWSKGPAGGYLDLFLQVDLGSIQEVNTIVYKPYGLANDVNYPVLINQILASSDGTNWVTIPGNPTWVGTIANQQAASVGANVSIGTASWNVGSINARYIQFDIRQPNPIPCKIGHLYYVDPTSNLRVEGPVPDVSNPLFSVINGQSAPNGLIQKTEVFTGQRWVIGINDISIEQNQYQATSTMITERINVNGIVDRLAINADMFIPADFNSSQAWITFWVSPDDGSSWHQISPIQNYTQGVNEVIAFNDPLPAAFQDPNVTYVSTDQPVTFLRFKIKLARPLNSPTESPIVKDYQLHVRIQ
jgi:hypothetical protein